MTKTLLTPHYITDHLRLTNLSLLRIYLRFFCCSHFAAFLKLSCCCCFSLSPSSLSKKKKTKKNLTLVNIKTCCWRLFSQRLNASDRKSNISAIKTNQIHHILGPNTQRKTPHTQRQHVNRKIRWSSCYILHRVGNKWVNIFKKTR